MKSQPADIPTELREHQSSLDKIVLCSRDEYENMVVVPRDSPGYIPLVDHLENLPSPSGVLESYTAQEIATLSETPIEWVEDFLHELGLGEEDQGSPSYPSVIKDVIDTEIVWQKMYEALPEGISLRQMEKLLYETRNVLANKLAAMGATFEVVEGKLDPAHIYQKKYAILLRSKEMEIPLAHEGEWFNIPELCKIAGRERAWVVNRLKNAGYTSERRRSVTTYRVYDYYPAEAAELISIERGSLPEQRPEGWKTEHELRAITGRSHAWQAPRLERFIEPDRWPMLDTAGRSAMHYSPEVVAWIVRESEKELAVPEASEDEIGHLEFAHATGHRAPRLTEICRYLGIMPTEKRDNVNRIRPFYKKEDIERVRDFDISLITRGYSQQQHVYNLQAAVAAAYAQVEGKKDELRQARAGSVEINQTPEEIEAELTALRALKQSREARRNSAQKTIERRKARAATLSAQ